MTLLEGHTADSSATADLAASDAPSSQPIFSDLIDRWLREGDRLHEAVGPSEPGAAPVDSPTQLDRQLENKFHEWKARARELLGVVIERHRLELLVAIGLVPLGLFLLVSGHAPDAKPRTVAAPAAPQAAPAPRLAVSPGPRLAPPAPREIAPEPMLVWAQAQPASARPKQAPAAKRAPVRPPRVVAHTSRTAAPAPKLVAKPQPAPAPVVVAVKPILPPAHGPGTVPKSTKATLTVNPKVAPNLKLASTPKRQ